MILRSFVLMFGLAGAFGAAQFPSYSQQYMQRLGGAVDALAQVVADFDASAASLGLSREAALGQMTGSAFVEARRIDMQNTFKRYEGLQTDLQALQSYGPFMRAYNVAHLTDSEITRGTWDAFEPSAPLSFAGLVFAAFGFVVSSGAVVAASRLLRQTTRRPAMPA